MTIPNNDWAIIIGIERYTGEGLGELKGPRSDARRFYDWVTSDDGGGVHPRNVTLFAETKNDAPDPTIEELEKAFIQLCVPAGSTRYRGRRLYIYLAGHGVAQNPHEASLLAADGGPAAQDRHVPGGHWLDWFLVSGYFDEVVLFADCCRTMQGAWAVRPFPLGAVRRAQPKRVRWVRGFAVHYGGTALELQEEHQGRGFFTEALLDALQHAWTRDGQITASSVNGHVRERFRKRRRGMHQEPSFVFDDPDLVFSTGRSPRARVRVQVRGGPAPAIDGGPKQRRWKVQEGDRPGEYRADLPCGLYVASAPGRKSRFFKVTRCDRVIHVSL